MRFKVNDSAFRHICKDLNIDLIDFKLEFGRLPDGTIVLADEICPGHLPLLGQPPPAKSWTRTASAATSAASRTPTTKSCAA